MDNIYLINYVCHYLITFSDSTARPQDIQAHSTANSDVADVLPTFSHFKPQLCVYAQKIRGADKPFPQAHCFKRSDPAREASWRGDPGWAAEGGAGGFAAGAFVAPGVPSQLLRGFLLLSQQKHGNHS